MWPVWREVFALRWQGWFSLKPNCVALVEGRVSIYMGCNGQGWFGAVFLEATLARWDLCCSMLVVERVYNLAISPHTPPPPKKKQNKKKHSRQCNEGTWRWLKLDNPQWIKEGFAIIINTSYGCTNLLPHLKDLNLLVHLIGPQS